MRNKKWRIKDFALSEIVPIYEDTEYLGTEEEPILTLDGFELFTGIRLNKTTTQFSTWMRKQLDEVDAVEGTDYVIMWEDKNSDCFKTIANIYTPQQLAAMGYRLKVIITLDIANEIVMTIGAKPRVNKETKRISKELRKYFVDCEKFIVAEHLKEQLLSFRRQEAHETYDFYEIIGDSKKCIALSKAMAQIASYKGGLKKIYMKQPLFNLFMDTDNKYPWQLYLDIKETAEKWVELYMMEDEEHFMGNTIAALKKKYIGDKDEIKKFEKWRYKREIVDDKVSTRNKRFR